MAAGMSAVAGIELRWRALSSAHRRWIAINGIVVAGLMSLLVGGGVAWLTARDGEHIPLWGVPSPASPNIATQTVVTLFVIPFLTCVFFTPLVWQRVSAGALAAVNIDAPRSTLDRLPKGRLTRGAMLGVLCAVLVSPVTLALLAATDSDGMSSVQFALFKTGFGTVIAVLVTPFVALHALTYPRSVRSK